MNRSPPLALLALLALFACPAPAQHEPDSATGEVGPLLWEGEAPAEPLFTPATRLGRSLVLPLNDQIAPTTQRAPNSSDQDRKRAADLSRQAADLIDQHHLPEARRLLVEALSLVPDERTCLYNLACLEAAQGNSDAAMDRLQQATNAGFTDFSRIARDSALASLHESPRFAALLAQRHKIIHRAAQHMLAELKEQLGSGYVYDAAEPDKLVLAVHAGAPPPEQLERDLRIEAASLHEQLFAHRSGEFITIILPTARDYARLERRTEVGGSYDDSTRTGIARRAGAELRHEFVHALHAADQHALGQEHPVWLSEGLAALYEMPKRKGEGPDERMFPADTWRLAKVQAAARKGELIPLDELLTMQREAFTNRATLAYGQSASLLLYLCEHDLLETFYDTYTAGYAHDHTGKAALEKATGKDLAELEKAWTDWMLSRRTVSQ